jgi:large conductance mechanosensitive channel
MFVRASGQCIHDSALPPATTLSECRDFVECATIAVYGHAGRRAAHNDGSSAMGWVREFKEFAFRGNLIDLAVAFVLGVAFAAVVTSLVNNIFMPIIGAIIGNEDLAARTFTISGVAIGYGAFLAALLNFLLIALILFFIVKAVNRLKREEEVAEEATVKDCPYCQTEIPIRAVRCPNCTSQLEAAPAT